MLTYCQSNLLLKLHNSSFIFGPLQLFLYYDGKNNHSCHKFGKIGMRNRPVIAIIISIITIILAGLVFATAIRGYSYFKILDNDIDLSNIFPNYSKTDYLQFMAFIIIAAAIAAIFSLLIIVQNCKTSEYSKYFRVWLILGVSLLLALSVVLAIKASETANLRQQFYTKLKRPKQADLDQFYILLIASAVGSFVVTFLWFILLCQMFSQPNANLHEPQTNAAGIKPNISENNMIAPGTENKLQQQ